MKIEELSIEEMENYKNQIKVTTTKEDLKNVLESIKNQNITFWAFRKHYGSNFPLDTIIISNNKIRVLFPYTGHKTFRSYKLFASALVFERVSQFENNKTMIEII